MCKHFLRYYQDEGILKLTKIFCDIIDTKPFFLNFEKYDSYLCHSHIYEVNISVCNSVEISNILQNKNH